MCENGLGLQLVLFLTLDKYNHIASRPNRLAVGEQSSMPFEDMSGWVSGLVLTLW